MTRDQFLERCKEICHVGPVGVWERVAEHGFQTAEQLITEADLDDEVRKQLLSTPRENAVHLQVQGNDVVLRDQGPLFARKDLGSLLGDDMDVSEWIHLLNQRVYFFTDRASATKLIDKYIQLDGAQEVIWLSPLRLLDAASSSFELTSQNSGAIARRSGSQKARDTFQPLLRFPGNKRPSELTILNGLPDVTPVFRVERHHQDGSRETLL
jgi:hypothetical protein